MDWANPLTGNKFRRLESWLAAPNPYLNYAAGRDARGDAETGRWILGQEQFLRWKKGEDRFCWLKGPGKWIFFGILQPTQELIVL